MCNINELYDFFDLSQKYKDIIRKIQDQVETEWKITSALPYFTTHGPEHNLRVISILRQLLSEYDIHKSLNEKERFLLIAAAWLHDIGMLDVLKNQPFSKETVREEHHKRSAQWVQEHAKELGLSISEADIVSHLVQYHRKKEDLEKCPGKMFARHTKIRCRFIAAFLRLADALHVDETRAPDPEYALYKMTGMPTEAKFHFVKAKVVQGVIPSPTYHHVKAQIGIPEGKTGDHFKALTDFIRQELEDEIETVRTTLASEGYPLILSVDVECVPIPGLIKESERAKEIELLNSLISIDVSPNARMLTEVVLHCLEQISKSKDQPVNKRVILDTLQAFKEYAKDLIPKVVTRRCHIAITKLFLVLIKLLMNKKVQEDDLRGDIIKILGKERYPISHDYALDDIKKHLTTLVGEISFERLTENEGLDIINRIDYFFKKQLQKFSDLKKKLQEAVKDKIDDIIRNGDRILLYGNSASVLDILESFKAKIKSSGSKQHYEQILESIEIFISECRVKSNHSSTNKIIYNDGLAYARKIIQAGFKKVTVVPDASIAHLLLPEEYYADAVEYHSPQNTKNEVSDSSVEWYRTPKPVNKVFIGFNGLNIDKQFATHSCGHLAVVRLAHYDSKVRSNNPKEEKKTTQAQVYLVGTTNKCGNVYYKHTEPREVKWLTGQEEPFQVIVGPENQMKTIDTYNPVDDIIRLDLVNMIITDCGVFEKDEFDKFREIINKMIKDELKDFE